MDITSSKVTGASGPRRIDLSRDNKPPSTERSNEIRDTFLSSSRGLTIRDAILAPLPGVGMMMNLNNWSRADASRDRDVNSAMVGGFLGAGANLIGSVSLVGALITQSPELAAVGAMGLFAGGVTASLGSSLLRSHGVR